MFQPNSSTTMEDINVEETTLNPVQEFTCFGSIIASEGHIESRATKENVKGQYVIRAP